MAKRYYWLKLKEDFFRQKDIKKLRQIAGGDTFTIIYLKILLRSLENGGKLFYDGIEDDFPTELALDIDERAEDVQLTVQFLMGRGILQANTIDEYELLTAPEMTGSEVDSAQRVRDHRKRKALQSNVESLPCNVEVTKSNDIKEIDIEKREKSKSKADKPPAHPHGAYGWVKLTDDQYSRLVHDLGEAEVMRCIKYIDESAQTTNNKNGWKDWNLVVRRCSREGWGRKTPRSDPPPPQEPDWRKSVPNRPAGAPRSAEGEPEQ